LFNATSSGSGCSTTALNFAAVLARDPHLKILLVEVNLRTPGLKQMLQIDNAPDLAEIVSNFRQMSPKIVKVGNESLNVITCGGGSLLGPLGLFESDKFDLFIKIIRERYDYVILDAPPVPIFSEFRVLCNKVDGVVLVINSEKTRRQVAIKAKKEIDNAGGKLLGAVLNRRKFYIPKWIYRRL
jgi:capsular exopolysaccharide synthesis family protein